MMAKDAQGAADLNLIGRKIAELTLNPAIVAQDGFLTTHLIEPLRVPERELIAEFLGRPDDLIDCPTPAQRLLYGDKRRRIPLVWDVDNPVMAGLVQNQDSYMQSVAAQRPFFFDHIQELTDRAMAEFRALTGREYARVESYRADDAEYRRGANVDLEAIQPVGEDVGHHLGNSVKNPQSRKNQDCPPYNLNLVYLFITHQTTRMDLFRSAKKLLYHSNGPKGTTILNERQLGRKQKWPVGNVQKSYAMCREIASTFKPQFRGHKLEIFR